MYEPDLGKMTSMEELEACEKQLESLLISVIKRKVINYTIFFNLIHIDLLFVLRFISRRYVDIFVLFHEDEPKFQRESDLQREH